LSDEIATSAELMEASVLPEARAVHCDPDAPLSPEQIPLPAKLAQKPVGDKSPAEWAYERMILYIKNFEEQLDGEHEVAMGFTGGDAGVLKIEGMGFFAPDIITFYGVDGSGQKSQQVQHVSQLNVTLRAVQVQPDKPANRIGFRLASDLEPE
jgi:hypothetical protein